MAKKEKTEKKKKDGFFRRLTEQIKTNKTSFIVYVILRIIVIGVIIRCAFEGRWESCFVGGLALILFFIPPFVEKQFKINLPTAVEIIVFFFVFCAEILGEIGGYYLKFPLWDTMLHTVNGFMFAAFGFCLVDILNKTTRFRFQLSPVFLSLVAFCFSMTIGIFWEFFELSADLILHTDMQKDFIVNSISSVTFDPTMSNTAVQINGIVKTTIETAGGGVTVINGYLDIGLLDTMKDLFVNFIGAAVFCVFGFFYVKYRGENKVARQFIPTYEGNEADK